MKFFGLTQKKRFCSVQSIHRRHHYIQSAVSLWCESQSTPTLLINFHTSFSLPNESLLYIIYSFASISIYLSFTFTLFSLCLFLLESSPWLQVWALKSFHMWSGNTPAGSHYRYPFYSSKIPTIAH